MEKNTITYCMEDFETPDGMWKDVAKTLEILTRNGYETAFRHEDCDVYILEYNYNRYKEFENPIVCWMEEEDYKNYLWSKEQTEDEKKD